MQKQNSVFREMSQQVYGTHIQNLARCGAQIKQVSDLFYVHLSQNFVLLHTETALKVYQKQQKRENPYQPKLIGWEERTQII